MPSCCVAYPGYHWSCPAAAWLTLVITGHAQLLHLLLEVLLVDLALLECVADELVVGRAARWQLVRLHVVGVVSLGRHTSRR